MGICAMDYPVWRSEGSSWESTIWLWDGASSSGSTASAFVANPCQSLCWSFFKESGFCREMAEVRDRVKQQRAV